MIIVSDTSPLSNLAIVGYLSLLQQIYNKVIIPQGVAEELKNASDEENLIAEVLSLDWIEVVPAKNLELISILRNNHNLDRGEAEAIASLAIGNALALELNADELLIDERLGRREATRLGLPITGVLGILLVAKHRRLIPAVQPVMDALMNQAGFRVSNQLYAAILKAADE
jgi:predicted nucleic acid-binding protein